MTLATKLPDVDPAELEAEGLEEIGNGYLKLARAKRAGAALVPMIDEWLTPPGVERAFGLKFRRLIDAEKRGELTLGRIGRTPAIRRADLDRWIATRTPRTRAAGSVDMDADYERAAGRDGRSVCR